MNNLFTLPIYGYIYIRCSKIYDMYDACKLGIASNIPNRNSVYITGEIEKGYFTHVFRVKKNQMRIIENILKNEFTEYHIKYDGGTEFYNKKIICLIEFIMIKYNILYKILTTDDIKQLERRNRAKIIIAKVLKKKILNKHNQLNKYISKDNIFKLYWITNDNIKYLQKHF